MSLSDCRRFGQIVLPDSFSFGYRVVRVVLEYGRSACLSVSAWNFDSTRLKRDLTPCTAKAIFTTLGIQLVHGSNLASTDL